MHLSFQQDAEVKQNFLDPLYLLESKEVKEINVRIKEINVELFLKCNLL